MSGYRILKQLNRFYQAFMRLEYHVLVGEGTTKPIKNMLAFVALRQLLCSCRHARLVHRFSVLRQVHYPGRPLVPEMAVKGLFSKSLYTAQMSRRTHKSQ